MESLKDQVDRVLGWLLVVLMAVSVINVLWGVFTRFVLNDAATFTNELARYLLIWVGILGAAYAAGKRVHLALELLPEKLTGASRSYLELFIEAMILIFAVLVLGAGGLRLVYVQLSLGQTSAAMGIPLGYVYVVLPLTGLIMTFYAIVHARRAVLRLQGRDIGLAKEEEGAADEDLHVG